MYYDPDAKGTHAAPRWTYLLCGVGLFIYQSLDAIGENFIRNRIIWSLNSITKIRHLLQMENKLVEQALQHQWVNFSTMGKQNTVEDHSTTSTKLSSS